MRTDDLKPAGPAEPGRNDDLGLRLRALSDRLDPPFGFDELQRRAQAAGRMGAPRRNVLRRPALWLVAAAATAALVTALGLYQRTASKPAPVTAADPAASHAAGSMQPGVTSAERYLRQRPHRALVKADSQIAVMALEDRIAVVDDQLNAARLQAPHTQQVVMLMQDRAQLVESLAQVRYAQDLVEMP